MAENEKIPTDLGPEDKLPSLEEVGIKSIFESKTFWINMMALAGMYLNKKYGFHIDPEMQMQILVMLNLAVRSITKDVVKVFKLPKILGGK